MQTDRSPGPTNAQVLLGLFIVYQLFFLFAANFLNLAENARPYLKEEPAEEIRGTFEGRVLHGSRVVVESIAPGWTHGEGHVHDAMLTTNAVLSRWSQVTGQPQDWSLFAPGINTVTTFVAVELRWDDDGLPKKQLPPRLVLLAADDPLQAAGLATAVQASRSIEGVRQPPELLLSDNEPGDTRSFFRLGNYRLRRYESNLDLCLSGTDDKVDERRVDGWRSQIEDKVRGTWASMHAYLRWRLAAFQRRRPDLRLPTQVILLVRVYRIPAPDEQALASFWQLTDQRRLARWLPGVETPEGFLPIEMYNPVVERFERLRAKPGE